MPNLQEQRGPADAGAQNLDIALDLMFAMLQGMGLYRVLTPEDEIEAPENARVLEHLKRALAGLLIAPNGDSHARGTREAIPG
ncbi:MAG: hypothetical protein ACREQB_04410 [Candidatus Binataceae bacterium]